MDRVALDDQIFWLASGKAETHGLQRRLARTQEESIVSSKPRHANPKSGADRSLALGLLSVPGRKLVLFVDDSKRLCCALGFEGGPRFAGLILLVACLQRAPRSLSLKTSAEVVWCRLSSSNLTRDLIPDSESGEQFWLRQVK